MRYIKKPVEVEAFQWKTDKPPKWFNFAKRTGEIICPKIAILIGHEIIIRRNEKEVNMAHAEDYIVKDLNGEIYPIKEDIFKKMYEKMEE